MTYQQTIQRFKEIIEAHKFIQTYGYGNLSDIAVPDNEEPPNYPYAFINPINCTINQNTFDSTFNLIVMTQVLDKEDDELFGQSNCIKYINDILAQFQLTNNDPLMQVSLPVQTTPFKERFQDDVVGATAVVTIRYGKPMSVCDSPITSIEPSTPYCPQTLVVDGDGSNHFLDAGDSYTCLLATAPSGIVYQRPTIGIVSQDVFVQGDERWQFENGLLPHPDPPVNPERVATAAIDNTYDPDFFPFALLKNENAFGNKYRWTNTAGKQGSQSTMMYTQPQFHYTDDWDDAIHGYVIDHLTGLAWTAYSVNPPNGNRTTGTVTHEGIVYTRAMYDYQSYANYAHGLNGEVQFERGGYRDWRVPTIHELSTMLLSNFEGSQWGTNQAGCSPNYDDESMNDWYNVRGKTGTPPRASTNWCWSSSFSRADTAFMLQGSFIYPRNPVTPIIMAGVFVRNHY